MEIKIKNRHPIKNKEIKKIQEQIQKDFKNFSFKKEHLVETGKFDKTEIILVDGKPCFVRFDDRIVFTVRGLINFKPMEKFVVVDPGAIGFITNGADVMAPGVVDADREIKKNDQVWVCDQINKKPLATGIAVITGEEMILKDKDKAVKIVSYVGDKLWDLKT